MIIHPEVFVTPDRPVVRLRVPMDQIDLDLEINRILKMQGWDVGTYFNLQFISHDRTELISCASFVVTKVNEELQTNSDNPQQPTTKAVFNRTAMRLGEWFNVNQKVDRNSEHVDSFNGEDDTPENTSNEYVPQKRKYKKRSAA